MVIIQFKIQNVQNFSIQNEIKGKNYSKENDPIKLFLDQIPHQRGSGGGGLATDRGRGVTGSPTPAQRLVMQPTAKTSPGPTQQGAHCKKVFTPSSFTD